MNISKVAERAGVGKATVSRVLNNKENIAPDTVKKVLKACKDLNYTPNYFASNLMKTQTNIIGLFLETDNTRYFSYYNELLEGCILKAYEHDLQILTYFNPMSCSINKTLVPGKSPLTGAVIMAPGVEEKRLDLLESNNIPYVIIGKLKDESKNYLSVDIDNFGLVYQFLKHLYDFGHRNIGFINSIPNLTISIEREKAVAKFISDHADCNVIIKNCKDIQGESCIAAEEICNETPAATAMIAASDMLAKELYDFFASKQMTVGKDISIISLGGKKYAKGLSPKLTHAEQNYNLLGAVAIELFVENLSKGAKNRKELIQSEIKWGDSVCNLLK